MVDRKMKTRKTPKTPKVLKGKRFINLTQEERQILISGINMRICYIETGDPLIRAKDAERMGKEGPKVKALNIDQMKLIVACQELIDELYGCNAEEMFGANDEFNML